MVRIELKFKKSDLDKYTQQIEAERKIKNKMRSDSALLQREFKKKYGI